jgi:1-deoxy-D-xylulose-5-phosphate reductoisomerase
MPKRKISLLGATGSIGQQTLDLIRKAPSIYSLEACAAAGNNLEAFVQIIEEFQPKLVSIASASKADELYKALSSEIKNKLQIIHGQASLKDIASFPQSDTVILGLVGALGLESALTALNHGKRTIFANKEPLVMAGNLIREALKNNEKAILIPADSEHVALHQCLQGQKPDKVNNLYLTASGGPFWNDKTLDFDSIKPSQALKHPTWQMGNKITIDSATLMNKGLEVIEAYSLFEIPYDKIQVLIHPQSLVHSMVEFIDGHVLAQLGANDMRLVLQYALDYPNREPNLINKFLNWKEINKLEFFEPDLERFKCLKLAYWAGKYAQTYTACLVAADEIAVELFLQEKIKFSQIADLIEEVLRKHSAQEPKTLEIIQEADQWARKQAMTLYKEKYI